MQKKAYLIVFLVIALLLTTWAVSPTMVAVAQTGPGQESASCREQAAMLPESFPEATRLRNRLREICNFNLRVEDVSASVSEFDRLFVENAIAANMLEIQSLEFALEHVTNEEWRTLITIMIHMHQSDLEMALEVAEKIGADTTPDLTRARVYPGTPMHDLGIRRVNLVAQFLQPLMLGAGVDMSTPTAVPTDLFTATVTGVPTDAATNTATTVPTDAATATMTTAPTDTSTATVTIAPTDTATETATTAPTETATATGTVTTAPTDTATATETATTAPTDTATSTGTATTAPTSTATTGAVVIAQTVEMTATAPGATATSVVTIVPTTPPTIADFNVFSMDIIEDEHVMIVETALAAERLVRNQELRAFAKHSADMAELHLLLIKHLKYQVAYNLMLPPPRFEEEYQSPRRLEP